jgi:CubicO group peptidase (beta-lactamase class C family)
MFERVVAEGDFPIGFDDLINFTRTQLSPHFPPQPMDARRQKVRYSDTNFMLLIGMIESVTGRPLHDVYDEFFFEPLELRHTWLDGYSKPYEPTLEPAQVWIKDKPLHIPLLMRSTWAIYSTVADTMSFLRALTDGSAFDDPATSTSMHRRWNRFGVPLDRAALQLPTWPIEYGLGIMRFHDPLLKFLQRMPHKLVPIYPAPAVIGHTGSTGSWLFHCPTLKLMLSGTVDQANAGALPYRLIPKILGMIHGHCQEVRS